MKNLGVVLAEQTARLASDPRYRGTRFDDDSQAAQTFRAPAVLYDGAGESSAQGLVAYTGLWSDPALHRNHCTSAEPQVWLFGYEPVDYAADDRDIAMLRVRPAAGYRFVVLTGTLRRTLVVAAGTKLATFDMSPWLTPASNLSANQTLPSSMPLPRSEGTPLPTVPPPGDLAGADGKSGSSSGAEAGLPISLVVSGSTKPLASPTLALDGASAAAERWR